MSLKELLRLFDYPLKHLGISIYSPFQKLMPVHYKLFFNWLINTEEASCSWHHPSEFGSPVSFHAVGENFYPSVHNLTEGFQPRSSILLHNIFWGINMQLLQFRIYVTETDSDFICPRYLWKIYVAVRVSLERNCHMLGVLNHKI